MPALMLDDDALVTTRCDWLEEASVSSTPFEWVTRLVDATTGEILARESGFAATGKAGWVEAGKASERLSSRYFSGEWRNVDEPF